MNKQWRNWEMKMKGDGHRWWTLVRNIMKKTSCCKSLVSVHFNMNHHRQSTRSYTHTNKHTNMHSFHSTVLCIMFDHGYAEDLLLYIHYFKKKFNWMVWLKAHRRLWVLYTSLKDFLCVIADCSFGLGWNLCGTRVMFAAGAALHSHWGLYGSSGNSGLCLCTLV